MIKVDATLDTYQTVIFQTFYSKGGSKKQCILILNQKLLNNPYIRYI